MKWVIWQNPQSGNHISKAHAASSFLFNRTVCGWSIGLSSEPAPKTKPRCTQCLAAIEREQQDRGMRL